MEGIIEEIEFLVRSPMRVRLLETVSDRGGMEKDELREAFDAARTTLTRNLEALEGHGLVRCDRREYSITPSGRAVLHDCLDLVETMDVARRYAGFFRWVDAAEFDLDPRTLTDAEVVVAEPGAPYAMVDRHVERLREATSIRATLPFTGLHAHEIATEQVVEHGASAELVVNREVAETHRSDPNYRDLTERMVATGRVEYHVVDGLLPYALAIVDDLVQLAVAEGDEPRALVESDSAVLYAWAQDTFDGIKREAIPMRFDQQATGGVHESALNQE